MKIRKYIWALDEKKQSSCGPFEWSRLSANSSRTSQSDSELKGRADALRRAAADVLLGTSSQFSVGYRPLWSTPNFSLRSAYLHISSSFLRVFLSHASFHFCTLFFFSLFLFFRIAFKFNTGFRIDLRKSSLFSIIASCRCSWIFFPTVFYLP